MFDVGKIVLTPKGRGEVIFAEDDYIEVDVHGNEIGFYAPFPGIMTMDELAAKHQVAKDLTEQKYEQAFAALDVATQIQAKINHMTGQNIVELLGGSAVDWEDLSWQQRLNFAKVKF